MSFVLELLVPDLDWELATRIEEATGAEGLVPVFPWPRRRWLRPRRPKLWMDDDFDDETPVFDDQAHWNETEYTLHPLGREALARSLLALDDVLDPSWTFRAHWVGDPVEGEVEMPVAELAELTRQSKLVRKTRYCVSDSR